MHRLQVCELHNILAACFFSRTVTGTRLCDATSYENALCSHNARERQTCSGVKSRAVASGPKLDSRLKVNVMRSDNSETPSLSVISLFPGLIQDSNHALGWI